MPTFKIYMDGDNVATVQGGDEPQLRSLITRYTKQLQVNVVFKKVEEEKKKKKITHSKNKKKY